MDDAFVPDLNQLITATIRQELVDVAKKEDLERFATKEDIRHLDRRLDDLESKADAIADAQAETLGDHERRITALEQHAV